MATIQLFDQDHLRVKGRYSFEIGVPITSFQTRVALFCDINLAYMHQTQE